MYMKDKDIADVLEACAQTLKGFDNTTTIEGMKLEIAGVAEALEGLAKDLRDW